MDEPRQSGRRASVLLEAKFNPRIKTYLMLAGIILCTITIIGIPLLPFWLLFGSLYINRYYNSLFCMLTTRALHFKKGVWFRVERTIPLDKIQDLTFKEGPLLRYLGLSILKVETAGQSVQGAADLSLTGIVGAQAFRARVLEQRDVVTEGQIDQPAVSEKSDTNVVALLSEIRDSLRSIDGKLTMPR
jgi:membrane protein YdbS with pleckstrin-like domain